jgi:hypothetical protein
MHERTLHMDGQASCPLDQFGCPCWPVVPIQVSSGVTTVCRVQHGDHIGGERSEASDKVSPAGHNE